MTLYAGGVTLGKVDMDATIRGDDYHVVSNLETGGIVNAFWQAQIQATSNGKIARQDAQAGALRLLRHQPLRQEAGSLADL